MLTHGIISDSKLVYSVTYAPARRQLFTIPLNSILPLSTYCELALQHDLHTIWVAPGSSINYWVAEQAQNSPGWEVRYQTIPHPVRGMPPIIRGITANRTTGSWGEKRRITIAFPQWNTYAWSEEELPGCSDPVACLAAIHYLEQALGMPLHHNAGVMGRQIIEETNSHHSRPSWVAKPTIDMMPFKMERKAGYDLKYLRSIDPMDIAPGLHLLAVDKNSQYLGACSSVELGTGNPVYINPEELELHYEETMRLWYDGKAPGYWRVDIEEFTHPLGADILHRGQKWITTPLLKLLYAMGARLTVREAWVWPVHHRILDKFGTQLWDARQSLKTDTIKYPHAIGRMIAYHSIKRIATAGPGLLASEDAAKYSPQWFRPDWRDPIVEDAKARLVYKFMQVEREFGEWPLMVKVDCAYYLTRAATPEEAFPGMFGNPDKLGGWKVEHSLPASYAVLDCFKNTTPGGASGKLKKLIAAGGIH